MIVRKGKVEIESSGQEGFHATTWVHRAFSSPQKHGGLPVSYLPPSFYSLRFGESRRGFLDDSTGPGGWLETGGGRGGGQSRRFEKPSPPKFRSQLH